MFGLLISKESKPSKEGKAAKNSRSAPTEMQGIVEYTVNLFVNVVCQAMSRY